MHLARVARSLVIALTITGFSTGWSLAAFQVVELSVSQASPGTAVTIRVGMSGRIAGTEPGSLFLIAGGTFGDAGPETVPCDTVPGAVEVGQMHWQAGTVEFEGESYSGVVGEGTFTVPQVKADVYRLAESTDAGGSLCHIFTLFDVVSGLPDTAMAP
jgi:hypothetical protein